MSSLADSAPDSHKKLPFWRRALRVLGWLLAAVVVIALGWASAQVALRRPRPALLYTEADLPNLPAQEDNGWEVLRVEMHALREPPRPDRYVTAICDGKATFTDRWPRVIGNAETIANIAKDELTRQWIEVLDKASLRPRYVDACPITFEPDCPRPLRLLVLQQMQEAVVLHDALDHQWDRAFSRTARMLRMATDYSPSARSVLTQAIGRALMHRTLTLVNVLLDGVEAEKTKERAPDAARVVQFAKEITPLVDAIHEKDLAALRIVVAEYLFSTYAIDHLTDSPEGRFSRGSTMTYDPGHTLEMVNERFEKYAEYAKRDGTITFPEFRRSRFWFVRNPVGHLAIEATGATIENQVPAAVKDRVLLLKDKSDLQKRLTALVNPQ